VQCSARYVALWHYSTFYFQNSLLKEAFTGLQRQQKSCFPMAKNVLEFFPHRLQESFGGAYTYLFHLRQAFPSGDVKLHF
jgi:hypothetical protein